MWVARHPEIDRSDPLADLNGDGLPLYLEMKMGLDPFTEWGDGAPPDPGAELERLRRKLEEMRENFLATREHLNPGIIGLDGQPTTIEGRRDQEYARAQGLADELRAKAEVQKRRVDRWMEANPGAVRRPYMVDEKGKPYWHGSLSTTQAYTNAITPLWPATDPFPVLPWPALTGDGREISLWDVNLPEIGHEQFGGRVAKIDPTIVAPPNASLESIARLEAAISHATSAACVLCGEGDPFVAFPGDLDVSDVLPETARGMSYESTVRARSSVNDESELVGDAGNPALDLRVSVHPYATACGWRKRSVFPSPGEPEWRWFGDPSIDAVEDWKFGAYTTRSANFDAICHMAPDHLLLPVWSAGNDGLNVLEQLDPLGVEDLSEPDEHGGAAQGDAHYLGDSSDIETTTRSLDGLSDGGGGAFDITDCIRPEACAKNVLSVGAELTAGEVGFYCVGPTDDGRIKPDIVASGGGYNNDPFLPENFPVLTAVREGGYANLAGSSFAAATVAGGINLALTLWDDRRGTSRTVAPWGSTLKALAIASAFPGRGSLGSGEPLPPDFRYGWGRFDATKMASLIHLDTETEAVALSHRVIKQLELPSQPGGGGELEFCIERIGGNFAFQDAIDFGLPQNNIGFFEIQVTICWTDPPGTPEPDMLDPTTPRLVNDLDVAILGPQASDGSWPPAASSIGTLNNVERATVNDADDGLYRVVISHKGQLHDGLPQRVSAVVVGAFGLQALGDLEILPTGVGGQHSLKFVTSPGGLFEVQRSVDLENWTTEAEVRAADCITTHDVIALGDEEFFRVRQID